MVIWVTYVAALLSFRHMVSNKAEVRVDLGETIGNSRSVARLKTHTLTSRVFLAFI